jgi:Protein of unknown function (DUF3105)
VSKESRRAARNAAREGSTRPGGTRPASAGPSGADRAGRRERVRRYDQKSFFERYRSAIIGAAVVVVAAVVVGLVAVQSTAASYTCSIEWEPAPTASPAAGATNRLGYAQDNMGVVHSVSRPQKYTFCPPASGNHYNEPGTLGPITPRVYRPTDNVGPPNWIHNLEHGGLVVLYRGDSEGATDAGLQRFREFFDSFPPSTICKYPAGELSPVVARFDDMKWPFAALLWDRVLPLPEWDPALAVQFYLTESERLDATGAFIAPPEPRCAAPSQSPAPSDSAAPSASPSGSPAASGSPSPAASGSASPSAVAPGASASPSPSAS